MMFKGVMDVLTLNNEGVARLWIQKIRNAPNLVAVGSLDDDMLSQVFKELGRNLGLWFSKEIGKDDIGAFFVGLGKSCLAKELPVSEITYTLLLAQRSTTEYISNESAFDTSMALYQALDITRQITEFFFLGSYYMLKGYLEDAYVALRNNDAVSDEILRKYFSDDFFFKDMKVNQ
jgi:hypothetical protein